MSHILPPGDAKQQKEEVGKGGGTKEMMERKGSRTGAPFFPLTGKGSLHGLQEEGRVLDPIPKIGLFANRRKGILEK